VKTSWRSWFWNIVLMVSLGMMALAGTATTYSCVEACNWLFTALFGAMSLWFWVITARALTVGVTVSPSHVIIREVARTKKIKWAEIEEIVDSGPVSGAAGVAGALSPHIIVSRPGRSRKVVPLSVLGGYGFGQGPTLAELAAHDLKERLSNWRRANPSTMG
jgi:hypothetical protein